MDFRILGPLEVRDGDRELLLGGRQQRALLALLLLHANEVVPVNQIVDELWPEAPPTSATKSLHALVSRLRRTLEGEPSARKGDAGDNGVVLTRAHGYVLTIAPGDLDRDRFESLLEAGRRALAAGHTKEASATLREALALWRGPPLAEFAHDSFAQVEIARLDELRLSALEERIEADLAAGRSAELVAEVDALVAAHPLRERLRGQLMLALYRSGRQSEALQVYQEARRLLVDELGVEPSPALQRLERSILLQEVSLEPPGVVSRRSHKSAQHSNLTPSPAEALTPSRERPFGWGFAAITAAALLVATVAIAAVLTTGGHSSLAPIKADSVAVLDPASGEIVGVVPVGVRPGVVAFGSGALWVANLGDRTVQRIDPATLAVTTTIPVGVAPTALAATTDEVWAAGPDGVIRRINPTFGIVTRTLTLERTPYGAFQVRALAVAGTSVWAAGNDGISQVVSARVTGERLRSTGSATAAAAGA